MGSGEQAGTGPDTNRTRPILRPPGTPLESDAGPVAAYRWVWLALAAVVVLSLAVIFLLPQLVSRSALPTTPKPGPEAPTPPVVQVPQPAPPPAVADVDKARPQAEQVLQQFLQLQAKLALENAEVWGEPDWSQAAVRVASGDRLFGERRFADAAQAYGDASRKLQALQERRGLLLDAALDLGQRALAVDDAQTALIQFERALAIEPGHEVATQGLRRAQVRDEVLEHMAAGNSAERNEELEAAQAAYRQATQLDGDYQPAIENLQRISRHIIELQFRDAMSQALAALDSGRLHDAGKALKEAAALKPEDGAVRNTRLRLVAAHQRAQLTSLRRQAMEAVENENWQNAADLYQKALSVDANAAFARGGLARVKDRLRLHQQFDHYLDDPGRLASSEPLANAEKLLSMAGEAPEAEPRLAEKIDVLKRYVSEARRPLPVELYSDGETEVVIYHVGRLGRFHQHQLELRPGTYTAVGSRAGFRDVRRVFTVTPGKPPSPVDIRCEEPV